MPHIMTCTDYGMNRGCDGDCPVLWEGTCDAPEEVLEQIEFATDEEEELLDLYGIETEHTEYKSIW